MTPRSWLLKIALLDRVEILAPGTTRKWKPILLAEDQVSILPHQARRARIYLRGWTQPIEIFMQATGKNLENEVRVPTQVPVTFRDGNMVEPVWGTGHGEKIYHINFAVDDGEFSVQLPDNKSEPFLFVGKESK